MRSDVHTRRRRRGTTAAATMIASLLAASCSSGSGNSVGVPIPDPASPVVESSPPPTDAPPTDPPATDPPATAATTSTSTTTAAPATSEAPTPTVATTVAPTTTAAIIYYSEGDEGPDVEIMQLKLITLGYLDEGLADGVFGSSTARALRNFQGQYGLGVDGVFGPLTDRALTAAANSVNVDGA